MVARPGSYVPDRGDVIWISFNPQAGHEQAGTRPALVLSPRQYNDRSSLALLCPITTKRKGRFEVPIPEGLPVSGVVLPNHIRSMDWRSRGANYACSIPQSTVADVLAKLDTLLR